MEDPKPIADLAQAEPRKWHGYRPVRRTRKPQIRIRKSVFRDPTIPPADLWQTFSDLCSGTARWPLFLHGRTGGGKTLASYCFCDIVLDAAWLDMNRLIGALITPGSPWWEVAMEREFLVLDEIGGRDVVKPVEYDALKQILDIREAYADRVGVYLSNHKPARIKELYDDRTASRLLCGTIYHLDGPDRRKSDV